MVATVKVSTFERIWSLVCRDLGNGIHIMGNVTRIIKETCDDYLLCVEKDINKHYVVSMYIPDDDIDTITSVTYYLAEAACEHITW